jgi:hypothetical protein
MDKQDLCRIIRIRNRIKCIRKSLLHAGPSIYANKGGCHVSRQTQIFVANWKADNLTLTFGSAEEIPADLAIIRE